MSPYRVVEYDSGPEGGDEAVKSEWADKAIASIRWPGDRLTSGC